MQNRVVRFAQAEAEDPIAFMSRDAVDARQHMAGIREADTRRVLKLQHAYSAMAFRIKPRPARESIPKRRRPRKATESRSRAGELAANRVVSLTLMSGMLDGYDTLAIIPCCQTY